jgi:hypothetical protein
MDHVSHEFCRGIVHVVRSMAKGDESRKDLIEDFSSLSVRSPYLLCLVILNFCITARLKPIRLVSGRGLVFSE